LEKLDAIFRLKGASHRIEKHDCYSHLIRSFVGGSEVVVDVIYNKDPRYFLARLDGILRVDLEHAIAETNVHLDTLKYLELKHGNKL
jgi:hypothetical protein